MIRISSITIIGALRSKNRRKICIYQKKAVNLQRKIKKNVMKARMLTRVNALIVFLIGLLGIGTTGCLRMKYGVPYYEDPEPKVIAEYGCPVPQEMREKMQEIQAVEAEIKEAEEPTK